MSKIDNGYNPSSIPPNRGDEKKKIQSPVEFYFDDNNKVANFKKPPRNLTQMLNEIGVLRVLNIYDTKNLGLKMEQARPIKNYKGLVNSDFIKLTQSAIGEILSDKHQIMSTFINHNGRDIRLASTIFFPDGSQALSINPIFNSINYGLINHFIKCFDQAMEEVHSTSSEEPSKPQELGLNIYEVPETLQRKYKPLIDYMHNCQRTNPASTEKVYLITKCMKAKDLTPDLKQHFQREEPVQRGLINFTDETQIISLGISSSKDVNADHAPLTLYTNTPMPLLLPLEEVLTYAGLNDTHPSNLLALAMQLHNDIKEIYIKP